MLARWQLLQVCREWSFENKNAGKRANQVRNDVKEGDSRILMQKLARDHVRTKTPSKFAAEKKLIEDIRASKNPDYRLFYELANVIVEQNIDQASKL